ncbi:hypothetical protein HDU85_003681 [Gaertneriomyces sp. JEL0708]|nr:hypothetical protein HDU85_003681 [Gaertneriomyces sp. JEL0708]
MQIANRLCRMRIQGLAGGVHGCRSRGVKAPSQPRRCRSSQAATAVLQESPVIAETPTSTSSSTLESTPEQSPENVPALPNSQIPLPAKPVPISSKSKQRSLFAIPSLFNKSLSLSTELADYPWTLSDSPSRRPRPTFWSALRDKHFLNVGIARARKHLQYPSYDFPDQFCTDGSLVISDLFKLLSDSNVAGDPEKLRTVMVKSLADRFAAGFRTLQDRGRSVSFTLKSKPKITVTGLHFTYGPYPAPSDYVIQKWWTLISLVIPSSSSHFISYPHQKEVMQKAMDDGVYFKIDTRVSLDVEFCITDDVSGIPIVRDRRKRVEVQFASPHFTPWDEVFRLREDGEWELRWEWRVSDLDWVVESLLGGQNEVGSAGNGKMQAVPVQLADKKEFEEWVSGSDETSVHDGDGLKPDAARNGHFGERTN